MRTLLSRSAGLFTILLLAGCGSDQGAWGEYFQIIRKSMAGSFRNVGITRDQAAAISYASLGFRVDGSNENLLVLATDNNGDLLWTAASHVVLLTQGGRVLRSVGLPHDVAATTAGNGSLPPLSDALRGSYRSTRMVDLPDINAFGVVLNCVTASKGPQNLSILGTTITTTRIDETCRSQKPRWSFTDNYWIDAKTGFAWHSVQHLHPAGTTIQIEIFRPPG